MKQILALNLKCDKLNQFIDIEGKTEQEITAIINSYDKKKWMILRKF